MMEYQFTYQQFAKKMRSLLGLVCLLVTTLAYAQPTNFYNADAIISLDPNAILYVGGHIQNTANGAIHNQGNIYLTNDWTNDNTSGGLDAATGKVILYGPNLQLIQGAATTTFNNLDCQGGAVTKKLMIDTKVGGNTGVLSLNASVFDLNGKNITVTNSSTSAVTRTTGYIISEIPPPAAYASVVWNIASSTGNYVYPFGTAAGEYIPFTADVSSGGVQTTTGNLAVSTYPTDVTASPNNRPLPNGVSNLDNFNSQEAGDKCVDRFWEVDMNNYSSTPTADYTFTYRDSEWDVIGGSTNFIHEDSLGAWPWLGTQWQNPPFGMANTSNKTVTATGINYSSPWTLKEKEVTDSRPLECRLEMPNAFSPNGDNHNDAFYLRGWPHCVSDFSIIIYNRWGEKVYESQNVNKSWDGTYLGKAQDPAVYIYYISAVTNAGEKITKKGNVTLLH